MANIRHRQERAAPHRTPARQARILAALTPFEIAVLVEGLERRAQCDAANPATLEIAAALFRRSDELRGLTR